MKQTLITALVMSAFAGSALAGAPGITTEQSKPIKSIGKTCTSCHQAEQGNLRGHFDGISFKAQTIQLKIDDSVELLKFDEDTVKILNEKRITGDGELLKDNKLKKGHEVVVEYTELNGVKTALKLTAKPPVELPADALISYTELDKLINAGGHSKKYFLFDSRPALRFQEGSIPTAVNLPFPSFDELAKTLLPKDKNAKLIFFCAGVTCNMSSSSAVKARALGYTNIKVYRDGTPDWFQKNYGVLSVKSFKDAWITGDLNHVLLDIRPAKEIRSGFIKGAVAFPSAKSSNLIAKLDPKLKKAPIIIYDSGTKLEAKVVASKLVKAGFGNVKILIGGVKAWKAAGFEITRGKAATQIRYTAKLRQGEIAIDSFKVIAAAIPANMIILDVRNPDETSKGMIKGAVNIPLNALQERSAELSKDKLILLQCNTGTQAEMAFHTLKKLGFSNIKFLSAKVKFETDGGYTITKE